ncbi:MAG TPA: Gfo/Idh/MocA family oxidoreductase [Roseiarcus sp.]|nr:Gfo/Idh/MocA family oxidoreductase [Roseiarcus sp.]
MKRVGIGVIGCGYISAAYLKAARLFPILDVRALADLNHEAAEARAKEFGLKAVSIEKLLSDPKIEVVVNLTIPKAHVAVGLQAIEAGKHVHCEKPLGITVAEAKKLIKAAKSRGLRIGCAPDTFLGGAHQTCRKLIDEGRIGAPVGGTAFFMCPGHERWHPNPDFYYEKGAGPMLDMGPYYVTALVDLLGPVARVAGVATALRKERVIASEPRRGEKIPVKTPTHIAGTLEFVSGAAVTIAMSFDVPKHAHKPLEIYGTKGSLIVPDPNHFDGEIEIAAAGEDWTPVATEHAYADGNYRIIGAADMAHAIRGGRPHRANGDLAFHVLEVMEAFERSSRSGAFVAIESRPERPAPLPAGLRTGELD